LVKRMVSYDLYEAGILPQDAQSSQEKW
jgi:hypothetical protein